MVRKKTALGRSVRKTEKRKIARAALTQERERVVEEAQIQSEETGSGRDHCRRRVRRDTGDRRVSPVRGGLTNIVLIIAR